LELAARRFGQLDELDRERGHGRRQVGQLRAERDTDSPGLTKRLAERQRPSPGAAADELGRHRGLPDRPPGPLRPRENAVEEDAERAHAELLELLLPLVVERKERERKRREELPRALVGDDVELPGTRDARRREGGEPALGNARAWIPGSTDSGERALQRPLDSAV